MKLYYSKGACSLTVRIVLHELNVASEYEAVNLKTKQTASGEDYLKINPKGAVPALLISKGELLTENAVILQYLADTYPTPQLLAPVKDMQRYRTLEWLNFITTDIHKTFGFLFSTKIPEEIKESVIKPILYTKFALLENRLATQEFIMGNHFTLPDAYLFVMLLWMKGLKMSFNDLPNLTRFFEQMKNRPSVKLALQEEELVSA